MGGQFLSRGRTTSHTISPTRMRNSTPIPSHPSEPIPFPKPSIMANSSFICPVPPGTPPVSRPGAVFGARNHPWQRSSARGLRSLPDPTGRCASGGNAGRRVFDAESPGRPSADRLPAFALPECNLQPGLPWRPTVSKTRGLPEFKCFRLFLGRAKFKRGQMFSTTRQSEVFLEPAPDVFVGMDQKERAIDLVNRHTGWLSIDSRHDARIGASRIDAGDAVMGHGCA